MSHSRRSLNQVTYFYPIVIVLIGVPLVFPDGRLLSPRWRWLVILTVAAMTAVTLDGLFRPAGLGVAGDIANPLGIPALVPILDALSLFTSLVSVVGFGGAAVSVVIRYRRAGTVERQQLKWLLAAAGVACVAFPVSIIMSDTPVSNALFLVGFFALIALPLAIGIAILRYRLYEIDRIISRTIGWAVVTGALVAVYLIAVLVLQWALGGLTNGDTIAVAVSTLVAAATFQPIRMRTQRAVDRRFDRARFDGERTAIAFAERLRSQAAIDSVATDLQSTVGVALRPASQGLWLRRAPE